MKPSGWKKLPTPVLRDLWSYWFLNDCLSTFKLDGVAFCHMTTEESQLLLLTLKAVSFSKWMSILHYALYDVSVLMGYCDSHGPHFLRTQSLRSQLKSSKKEAAIQNSMFKFTSHQFRSANPHCWVCVSWELSVMERYVSLAAVSRFSSYILMWVR